MKVVKKSNLPVKLPVFKTLTVIIALDYWSASPWICGAVSVLMFLMWAGSIFKLSIQKEFDLFENSKEDKDNAPERKSNFQERLNEALRSQKQS